MKNFIQTKKHLLLIIFLIFLALPRQGSAVGIITQDIVVKDAIRGQLVRNQLQLVNSKDEAIIFELSAEGELAKWVSFYSLGEVAEPLESVSVPAKDKLEVGLSVKIPDDQPNGTYEGNINAFYKAETASSSEENPVSISQKFSRRLELTITDKEIVEFSAQAMPMSYEIVSGKPLEIRFIYENKGNISIKPQADIRITDLEGKEIFGAIYPYPEKLEAVPPLESKEVLIDYNTGDLQPGKYKALIKVNLAGKEKLNDEFLFIIKPAETTVSSLGNKDKLIIGTEVGLGIILIGLYLWGNSRKKNQKKEENQKSINT